MNDEEAIDDEESRHFKKPTLTEATTAGSSFPSITQWIFDRRYPSSTTRLEPPVIKVPLLTSSSRSFNSSFVSYDSFTTSNGSQIIMESSSSSQKTIRFQVVVWYVGKPDEVLGKVEMKFRVTIFWNNTDSSDDNDKDVVGGYGSSNPFHRKVWKLHGRQRAYQTELAELGADDQLVYVPPVSILNAVDFECLDEPEVCQLNSSEDENRMKWTCLYKANLLQDDMRVSDFPHDSHNLVLRLGILKHRQRHKRWDKTRWKLSLATEADTEGTIDTPHGTIVDHVQVPGYSYNKQRGLDFEFLPLEFGSQQRNSNSKTTMSSRDHCLQVKLRVTRESSYYDRNIVPLLAALNTVGISTLALTAEQFGSRGEMLLAAAFVEIGIRMTVDSRLPVVGYQIKMQWILNNFFFGLIFLVCESCLAYLLFQRGYDSILLDQCAAIMECLHMLFLLFIYFGKGKLFEQSWFNFFNKDVLIEQ